LNKPITLTVGKSNENRYNLHSVLSGVQECACSIARRAAYA
jgi:hypothetical protein